MSGPKLVTRKALGAGTTSMAKKHTPFRCCVVLADLHPASAKKKARAQTSALLWIREVRQIFRKNMIDVPFDSRIVADG